MEQKNVLITGASRGIGKSAALLFASRRYHVFLNCRTSVDELQKLKYTIETLYGSTCDILPADISHSDEVAAMFQKIYHSWDALDVLINNAGISHIGLLSDMSNEEWDHVLRTNLSSVFYCCRAAIPAMVARQSGRIINVSSMWGTSGASCEAAYSASKAGVNGLTRALAKELAPSNIQVNAAAFGVIDTDMNSQLTEEERSALSEEIPIGRFATPDEAALMLWNIATAPEYMTGQIIGMDGGFL